MNPLHDRRAMLVLVALACALMAIVGDRPMFASTLFPALYVAMLGRARRGPPAMRGAY